MNSFRSVRGSRARNLPLPAMPGRFERWVWGIALGCALGLLFFLPASLVLAAERDFTLRYDVLAVGANLAQIGNAVTTCESGTNNLDHSSLTCSATQDGSNGLSDDWYNDQYRIVFSDVDGDASTFNSSTATLNTPAGVTLLHAQLYWGGSFNASTLWDQSLAQTMKLKGPTGGYVSVTATQLDWKDVTTGAGTGRSYGATADVTALFPVNGSWLGVSKTFTGANVKSSTGCTTDYDCPGTESNGAGPLGNYAGWSLLIVYQDPADTTHIRYVGLDDGFRCVVGVGSSCPDTLNVSFTGFNVPANSSGNRWGILAWDGDHGTGDNFYLNGVQQSDAAHPVNDFFRSRISVNGTSVSTRNPSYTNNLGTDIVESNTGDFTGGTTTLQGEFNTGGELVLLHYFWLVTESTIINYDYGDDPSSYGSASHQISGNLSATTLRLGTDVTDSEAGMQHTTLANGDNILATNDEQGVAFPVLKANATTYSVLVRATDTFGSAAHLYGWMDWNNSGVFDASEFVSQSVPNGTNNQLYTLTWNSFPAIPIGTRVYFRFRITTATLTGTNATGVALNGEVEDYQTVVTTTTSATLVRFDAGPKPKGVRVRWSTGSEATVVGFNVWRSNERTGEFHKLNSVAIESKHPGELVGARYAYLDKTAKKGKTYFYRLEIIHADGTFERSAVKKVVVPKP